MFAQAIAQFGNSVLEKRRRGLKEKKWRYIDEIRG